MIKNFWFSNVYLLFQKRLKVELKAAVEELKEKVERGEDVKAQFWKIVGEVKRRDVDKEVLRDIAEIRDLIFDKKTVLSAKTGNILFPILFLLSNASFLYAALTKVSFVLLLLLEAIVLYFTFLNGRVLGSRLTGIKIEGYYRLNPVELGMKLDFESYLKVPQKSRVLFFLTPILFEHAVLLFHALILYLAKTELHWIPLLFVFVNIPFSYLVYRVKKTGELYRFLRELKILKELSEKPPSEKDQEDG